MLSGSLLAFASGASNIKKYDGTAFPTSRAFAGAKKEKIREEKEQDRRRAESRPKLASLCLISMFDQYV